LSIEETDTAHCSGGGGGERHNLRHGLAGLGDDEGFSRCRFFDEAGQMGLGLVDNDRALSELT
jgi:hypothetical protein